MSQKAKEMKRGFTPLECCSCNKESPLFSGVISKSHFSAKRRSQFLTGFTLIEIIVAMVIISILAAGIFATVSFSKRVTMRGRQTAMVTGLIESMMSELKDIGAKTLTTTGSVSTTPVGPLPNGPAAVVTDCPAPTAGIPPEYCQQIKWNGQSVGIVKAQVTEPTDISVDRDFKEILITARWFDPTLGPNAVRTESAYTAVFQE